MYILNQNRLKTLLKNAKLTYFDLTIKLAEIGYSITEISVKKFMQKNNPVRPSMDTIMAIAKVLACTYDELIVIDDDQTIITNKIKGVNATATLYNSTATIGGDIIVNLLFADKLELPSQIIGNVQNDILAIKCVGDSLMPCYNDGDIILMERVKNPNFKRCNGVYLIKQGANVYLKRLEFTNNDEVLMPNIANPLSNKRTKFKELEFFGYAFGKINIKIYAGLSY